MTAYKNPNDALCNAFNRYAHQNFLIHRQDEGDNDLSLPAIYAHSYLPFLKQDEILISQDTRIKHATIENLQTHLAQFGVTLTDIAPHSEKEKESYSKTFIAKLHAAEGLDTTAQKIEILHNDMHRTYTIEHRTPDTIAQIDYSLRHALDQLVPNKDSADAKVLIQTLEAYVKETLKDPELVFGDYDKSDSAVFFPEKLALPADDKGIDLAKRTLLKEIQVNTWMMNIDDNSSEEIRQEIQDSAAKQFADYADKFTFTAQKPTNKADTNTIEPKGKIGNDKETGLDV